MTLTGRAGPECDDLTGQLTAAGGDGILVEGSRIFLRQLGVEAKQAVFDQTTPLVGGATGRGPGAVAEARIQLARGKGEVAKAMEV